VTSGTVKVVLLILLTVIAAAPSGPSPRAPYQERFRRPDLLSDPVLLDTSADLGTYIAAHIDEFATPEFYERKEARRQLQRAGYTTILHDVLALDPVGALFSFFRTRLQIEYSLPHNTIYFRTVSGGLIPLPEDWTFPADPWAD